MTAETPVPTNDCTYAAIRKAPGAGGGARGRTPALHVCSPKFKPPDLKKRKKGNSESL
jgi:hypothetical protein